MFACGSNTFGQLGVSDLSPRYTPTKVRFPEPGIKIVQIAAGSYHSVALDSEGIVYTCGAHTVSILLFTFSSTFNAESSYIFLFFKLQKEQLARLGDDEVDVLWFAKMATLDNIGVKVGRRVTWIGAAGDSTYMRLEASLISPNMLQKSTVTANSSTISENPSCSYF